MARSQRITHTLHGMRALQKETAITNDVMAPFAILQGNTQHYTLEPSKPNQSISDTKLIRRTLVSIADCIRSGNTERKQCHARSSLIPAKQASVFDAATAITHLQCTLYDKSAKMAVTGVQKPCTTGGGGISFTPTLTILVETKHTVDIGQLGSRCTVFHYFESGEEPRPCRVSDSSSSSKGCSSPD